MIDLHCHILQGIDDGSHNLKESIEMAKAAYSIGYRKICCTPHYGFGKYENHGYKERFSELSQALKNNNIHIELITGNELYLDPEGIKSLGNGKVNLLGNSSYILVEAVPGMTSESLLGAIEKVIRLGYKPVLAHVERYFFLKLSDVKKLERMGVVLQMNLSSLTNSLRNRCTALLEKRLVHVVASDAHGTGKRNYGDLLICLEELEKIAGKNMAELMTKINPKRIIEGCPIEGGVNEEEQGANTGFFSRFFTKFFRI